MDILTKYGMLSNCRETTYFNNDALATAFAYNPSRLETSVGTLALAHDFSSPRRKYIPSVKFFKDGALQAVNLAEQTEIETSVGNFFCEYITFYPSGAPCRLFHLNGKLSGYWSEQQETKLAQATEISLPCGTIKAKIMTMHLYEAGQIASITFFPGTVISVETNIGCLKARIGLSFHDDGTLKSIEPAAPIEVETPLGRIHAFDTQPIGITGDKNSLCWNASGELCSCKTTDTLNIKLVNENIKTIIPDSKLSLCSDDAKIKVPYVISWDKHNVHIEGIDDDSLSFERHNLI